MKPVPGWPLGCHAGVELRPGLHAPDAALAETCERYNVRELAIFGSSARGDFRPDGDLDMPVDFREGAPVGLVEFAGLQEELQALLGLKVDLVPKRGLKPLVRGVVLSEARTLYSA